MLYDLNVPWSPTQSAADLERTISFLSNLGYNVLALNHTLNSTSLPSQITNPIPTTPSFALPKNATLLRRCTLTIHDPSLNHRLPVLASAYDILALRPTTEKAFQAACLSLNEHSIISLDLTQRFPFHFLPKKCMAAVNRGIRFEICYGQATFDDSGARRNFISNVMALVRCTKGRGFVLSSEARDVLGCRSPADVLNLLNVWGLSRDRGVEAMGVNPRGVVVNEGLKRSAFRGVIDVIDGGEREVPEPKEPTGAAAGEKKAKQTPKRKAEDAAAQGTPDSTQPISKRKAKKMRLEALKSSKEVSSSSPLSTPGADMSSAECPDTTSTIKTKANG